MMLLTELELIVVSAADVASSLEIRLLLLLSNHAHYDSELTSSDGDHYCSAEGFSYGLHLHLHLPHRYQKALVHASNAKAAAAAPAWV